MFNPPLSEVVTPPTGHACGRSDYRIPAADDDVAPPRTAAELIEDLKILQAQREYHHRRWVECREDVVRVHARIADLIRVRDRTPLLCGDTIYRVENGVLVVQRALRADEVPLDAAPVKSPANPDDEADAWDPDDRVVAVDLAAVGDLPDEGE